MTNQKAIVVRKSSCKPSIKGVLLTILCIFLFALGVTFIFFSNWFIGFFGQLTPEQFLFNLKSPIKGTSSGMVNEILSKPVLAIVVSTVLFTIVMNIRYELLVTIKGVQKSLFSRKTLVVASWIVSIVVCVGGITFGVKKLSLDKVAEAYFSNSSFIEENYADPRKVAMSFPKKKRNLIHIYAESMENSYLSKELGGYMEENLMPELTKLAEEGIHFSNTDTFGGPYQTYGSSWSVAAMINMGVGIPLKIPMDGNSYGMSGTFLPGAIAIGDILEEEGYNQTIMFGADADYGGLTTYFTSHGNFNIFDYYAAKEKNLFPEDYYVWWGFEDDKLFQFAKDELTRLSNEGKPFNFTMETADTHFPDGYLSPNVENKYEKQYANVISYSDQEIVKFVRWIQQQPFYENTTIVITGDHLSMDQNFFSDFDDSYQRTVFNLILNSPITTSNTKNREFAPFDFYPTILASMGIEIEGNRLALGTNLFSDAPTLVEKYGLDELTTGLTGNSNFFNDEFINEDKNSVFDGQFITTRPE